MINTQMQKESQYNSLYSQLASEKAKYERLNKELENTENEILRAKSKLENAGFVAKAPAQLIENEKAKLVKYNDLKQKIVANIENFKKNG